jgi:hypothetical protein
MNEGMEFPVWVADPTADGAEADTGGSKASSGASASRPGGGRPASGRTPNMMSPAFQEYLGDLRGMDFASGDMTILDVPIETFVDEAPVCEQPQMPIYIDFFAWLGGYPGPQSFVTNGGFDYGIAGQFMAQLNNRLNGLVYIQSFINGAMILVQPVAPEMGLTSRAFEGGLSILPKGVSVASTGLGSAPATVVREIAHGEAVSALINEAAARTYTSGGLEHAIISTHGGQRLMLQGGPGGMSFEGLALRRVLGHTHPMPTGPSAVDFGMLEQTGQRSSWIYELFGGGLTRFRSP